MPITYPDKELYIDKPEIPYDKKLTFTDANEIKNVVNANEAELAEKWNTSGTTTLTGNTVIDGDGHNLNINPEHLEVTAVQHVNLEAPVLDFTTVAATNGYQIAAANGLGLSVIKVTAGVPVAGILIYDAGVVTLFSNGSAGIQSGIVVLTDAASMAITANKHTLATSSATRTFTISYTGDDITLIITLSATSSTLTFPATSLCVSEGVASGNNTCALAGVSGDKYVIAIKKVGTDYYVVCKNFGQ